MTRGKAALNGVVGRRESGLGAGVTKATRGQSDLKAIHEREVFTMEKGKRDRLTSGKAFQPPCVFVFK